MENFEMVFDVKKFQFTHTPTGYVLNGEYMFYNDNRTIAEDIFAGTGVEVDDFFVQTLKDTVVPF